MNYSEVLSLLDADTMTDMVYEDREKGGPSRSLEQLVRDFAKSQGIKIEEDKK